MKNEQNTEPDPHKVGNFFIDPCISLKDDLGIDPDDDIEDQLYDVIDHSTEIAEKPCGFEREADSISRDVEEEQAFVAKAKGKDVYILYGYPAFNEYDGIGCDPTFEYYVGTKDEAMRRFDNIRYNEPPMRKRIADVKEQLDGIADDIWIDAKTGMYDVVRYNVKYKGYLIIEKAPDLNAEEIIREAKRFDEFNAALRKDGYILEELYKMPRAWNDNQRYYGFVFTVNYDQYEIPGHIKSKLQGKERYPIDFLPADWKTDLPQPEKLIRQPYPCPLCGITESGAGCSAGKIIINGIEYDRVPVSLEETAKDGCCIECGAPIGSYHHAGCTIEKIPGKTLPLSRYMMIDQDDEPEITYAGDGKIAHMVGYPGLSPIFVKNVAATGGKDKK